MKWMTELASSFYKAQKLVLDTSTDTFMSVMVYLQLAEHCKRFWFAKAFARLHNVDLSLLNV